MLVPPGALQPKTVRPSLPAPLSNPRRTSFFALIFRPEDPPKNLPLAEIFKKAAANLVQILLNPFIISIFSQKSRRKKRPEIDFFRSFSAFFSPFWLLFHPPFGPPLCPFCRALLLRLSASVCAPSSQRAKGKSCSVRAANLRLARSTETSPICPGFAAPQSRVKRVRAELCCKFLIFHPLTASASLPIIYRK
jgi:hypothetical protein